MASKKNYRLEIRIHRNPTNYAFLVLNLAMIVGTIFEIFWNLTSSKYSAVSLLTFLLVLVIDVVFMRIDRGRSQLGEGRTINYGVSFLNFAFVGIHIAGTLQLRFDPFLAMGAVLVMVPFYVVVFLIYWAAFHFLVRVR